MAQETKVSRSVSITGGGVTVGGVSEQVSVDNLATFKKAIPANTVNVQLVKPDVTFANIRAIAIVANKDATVCTNAASTGSPTETLVLKANKMLHWMNGDPDTTKFLSADVANWYVTTGGEETLLTILVAEDATPALTE